MTVFLIIIVIALFAVTLWQLAKIYKLSRSNDSADPTANDKDNKMQGNLMLAFGIAFYLGMLYCFLHYSKFYLPEAASAHGSKVDHLMFLSIAIIMFVQVITQGLLYFFAFKYKGKKGKKALFFADNDRLEFVWTIIPVIVLAGLIIYGLFTWSDIMNINDKDDPMVIELYAYQFAWRARYSGEDNTLGGANVRFIEGVNQLGLDESDPYGQDDIITTELHLPVNQPVVFKLRSQDVTHSAFFPHFRAQMNVMPGLITQFAFTPTITTNEMRQTDYMQEKVKNINKIRQENSKALVANGEVPLDHYEFDYYLLCNKVCGEGHYNMQMKIIVESQDEYNEWIKKQQTFGEMMASQRKQDTDLETPAQGEKDKDSTGVAAVELEEEKN